MIKEVLASIDLTAWAEVALLMFAAVFVAVSIKTLLGDRKKAEQYAGIVLSDDLSTESGARDE